MAIIRQRKRNIIIASLIGFAAGVIPAGAVAVLASSKYISLNREYTEAKESYRSYTAYVLSEAKTKGDVIKPEDLKEITFYSTSELSEADKDSLAGRVLRQGTEKGIIITETMVYEDTGVADDLRMYMIDYIGIPEGMDRGAVFDIRIAFPNGEDYIVAKEKSMEAQSEEGIFINATEKELLMLSSAYVDTNVYEGSRLYASIYVTDYQEPSVVNYPVNMYVTKLADWDPNLIKEIERESDVERRQILEQNLYEFMGVTIGGITEAY